MRVLLMDAVGAVGLDLSFASYVFLMEPIADRSLEEQVISRAHRMGAVAPVVVEVLAMKGTVEEEMLKASQLSPAVTANASSEQMRGRWIDDGGTAAASEGGS